MELDRLDDRFGLDDEFVEALLRRHDRGRQGLNREISTVRFGRRLLVPVARFIAMLDGDPPSDENCGDAEDEP